MGEVSGIPKEQLQRKVVVYSPARHASQQGMGRMGQWKIRFDSTQKWENPLMGWTSTADPMACVSDSALSFETREQAVDFASRHGWGVEVLEPHKPVRKVKSYAENFRWKGFPDKE